MVERLFLTVPRGCLQFVIVVFPDHTHLLFFITEWVIHNELLPLKLGKSSIRMGFTWQGSDHIQEILISSVVIYDTKFTL